MKISSKKMEQSEKYRISLARLGSILITILIFGQQEVKAGCTFPPQPIIEGQSVSAGDYVCLNFRSSGGSTTNLIVQAMIIPVFHPLFKQYMLPGNKAIVLLRGSQIRFSIGELDP